MASPNVTEMSLDNLGSTIPSVAIDRVATTTTGAAPMMSPDDAMDDLDLLVDPSKSRQASPSMSLDDTIAAVSAQDSAADAAPASFETVKIDTIGGGNIGGAPAAEEESSIDFSINVVPPKESDPNIVRPRPSTFMSTPYSAQRLVDDGVERQELLFKLKRLESRGIPLSQHYSNSSSLEDMRGEYSRLKSQRDLENSIKFQRKSMMALASGVEFLNSKFDPFDIKLDGWSESLHENLTDYDDVFEELHEKYKSKTKIAPELKLLMMLGGSAVMFHMTNSFFKSSMPDMDDVLRQNPDLARQFAAAAVSSSTQNNPGLGHVLGDMLGQTGGGGGGIGGGGLPAFVPPQPSFMPEAPPPPAFTQQPMPIDTSTEMSGPKDQDVERILNQIQEARDKPIPPAGKGPTKDVIVTEKKKRGRPRKNPVQPAFPLNI